MRYGLVVFIACFLCAAVGGIVGYYFGLAAARRKPDFDRVDWSKRKPPSAVDDK